jgi:transcriptional regulator with XRE-family HTH domain
VTKEEIIEAREIIMVTQRELAKILGVSKQLVGNWELGKSKPKPDKVEAIQQMLRDARERRNARVEEVVAKLPAAAPSELTLSPQLAGLMSAANYILSAVEIHQMAEGPLGDPAVALASALGRALDGLRPEDRQRVAGLVQSADRKLRALERNAAARRVH